MRERKKCDERWSSVQILENHTPIAMRTTLQQMHFFWIICRCLVSYLLRKIEKRLTNKGPLMHILCAQINPSLVIKPWSAKTMQREKKSRFKFLIKKLFEYFNCVWAQNILWLHKNLLHVVHVLLSFRYFHVVYFKTKIWRACIANSFDVLHEVEQSSECVFIFVVVHMHHHTEHLNVNVY